MARISGDQGVQLTSKSAEDFFLTEGPLAEKTSQYMNLFTRVHMKYIDFAETYIEKQFNGSVNFGSTTTQVDLPEEHDYIETVAVRLQISVGEVANVAPATDAACVFAPNLGYSIIEEFQLKASNVMIDLQRTNWFNVYKEFFVPQDKLFGLNKLIGEMTSQDIPLNTVATVLEIALMTNNHFIKLYTGPQIAALVQPAQDLIIPIPLCFGEHHTYALPYIHSSRTTYTAYVKFRSLANVYSTSGAGFTVTHTPEITSASILTRGCTIDPDLRHMFAQQTNKMIMWEIQEETQPFTTTTLDYKVSGIRGPVPMFFPLVREQEWLDGTNGTNLWNNYTAFGTGFTPITSLEFRLGSSNTPRYTLTREMIAYLMPYEHLRKTPNEGYNVLPFCLDWKPSELLLCGTINMNRFTNSSIFITVPLAAVGNICEFIVLAPKITVLKFVGGTVVKEYY